MQSITSDMIRAGSKNGSVIGFMGVIGSALATVMPKAEPIVPMKAPGCHWEFHGGAIGISESLYVFDAGVAAGYAGGLPDGEAAALADYLISLWTRFRNESHDTNGTAPKEHVQANRNKLAKQFLDVESDVRDLCRAVKVVSCVVYDELADPTSGEPATSGYGLDAQTFQYRRRDAAFRS
jgi:hypothetical protein